VKKFIFDEILSKIVTAKTR